MLLIVTPGFPKDERDTTCLPAVQQFIISLIKIHDKKNVTVLSFQYPFICKEYYWHGVKVISLGRKNKSGVKRLFTWFRAYKTMRKLHKQNSITGILSFWLTECAFVGNIFAKLNNIKIYMWLHGQDAKKSNRYVKRTQPKASQIIAISDFIKREFAKNHSITPFMVAENGINPEFFPKLNVEERSVDILGVGSLIILKNYPKFLEIVRQLTEAMPHLKVKIAGEGVEQKNIELLLAKMNLVNNVELLGSIPHSEVFDLMNQSKIFLHTSDYEGNSTVLIEALYSGCKVVSTQALSDEQIKNLLVTDDVSQIVKHIELHLQKKTIVERVSFNLMDNTAKQILSLYE